MLVVSHASPSWMGWARRRGIRPNIRDDWPRRMRLARIPATSRQADWSACTARPHSPARDHQPGVTRGAARLWCMRSVVRPSRLLSPPRDWFRGIDGVTLAGFRLHATSFLTFRRTVGCNATEYSLRLHSMSRKFHAATHQAIQRLGGKNRTAKLFGVTRQAVQKWAKNGAPQDRIEEISRLSRVGKRRLAEPPTETASP